MVGPELAARKTVDDSESEPKAGFAVSGGGVVVVVVGSVVVVGVVVVGGVVVGGVVVGGVLPSGAARRCRANDPFVASKPATAIL